MSDLHSPLPESPRQSSGPNNPLGFTEEELAEAKRYGKQRLILSLARQAIQLASLFMFAFWIARILRSRIEDWLPGASLQVLAVFVVLAFFTELLEMPVSFFSGFVLEHRYGLSRQTAGKWLMKQLKQFLLSVLLGGVLFLGLFWLIWTAGKWWWLCAAGGYFAVSIVLGQLAPVLILPLFYKVERIERPDLLERMGRLVEGTRLSVEGLYRIGFSSETVKANAMLAGLGRTRRVILGDTLLDQFEGPEIEVILAHEVGHHVHGHITRQMFAGVWFSLVGFWCCDAVIQMQMARNDFGYQNVPATMLPLLVLVLSVYFTLLGPIQNGISRRYERQSDRYALRKTRLKNAYVSAFSKLARINKADPAPHPLEVFLFHSHPPIGERIALANRVLK